MCRRVRCEKCGKTGWAGCGAHVEQVMAGLPDQERCTCNKDGHAESGGILSSLGFGKK